MTTHLKHQCIVIAGLLLIIGTSVKAYPTTGTTEFVQTWTEVDMTELPVYESEISESTTTTKREEIELLADEEETTTLRSVTEISEESNSESTTAIIITTTTTASNATQELLEPHLVHPDKEDILNELQNIWYYTEGLDDDQNELKSSLSSLVHMTYARVYDQPDETLSRLKHLLRKLRTRLVEDVEPTTTESLSGYEHNNNNNNNLEQSAVTSMRRKRSYQFGNDDVSIIFDEANPDENSLYPIHSIGQSSSVLFTNSPPVTKPNLSDTTIQKVIHVEDRFVPVTLTEASVTVPDAEPSNVNYSTLASIPLYEFNFNKTLDSIKNHEVEKDSYQNTENNTTVDDIIQSIITVLREPTPPASRPSSLFSPTKLLALSKLKPSINPVLISNGNSVSDSENESSKFSDFPPYLQKLSIGSLMDASNATVISAENEAIMDLVGGMTTELSEIATNTSVTELTNNDGISSPTKILNGTMEKLMVVVNTFTNLPNAARLVLYFSVMISVLSIALGLYSLGPPIVVVGVLGIIIPVLLLLLFQNNMGKRKNVKEDIIANFNVNEMQKVLDLIADAILKYQNN